MRVQRTVRVQSVKTVDHAGSFVNLNYVVNPANTVCFTL